MHSVCLCLSSHFIDRFFYFNLMSLTWLKMKGSLFPKMSLNFCWSYISFWFNSGYVSLPNTSRSDTVMFARLLYYGVPVLLLFLEKGRRLLSCYWTLTLKSKDAKASYIKWCNSCIYHKHTLLCILYIPS